MKKKIVVVLVVVAVIAGVVAGAVAQPYRILPAKIKDVDIWAGGSSRGGPSESKRYYLLVVAGGHNTCWKPWRYNVTRLGNTIFVEVLTLHHRGEPCGMALTYEEKTISLGRCFIPDMKYWVVVNGMVEPFIA
jgi:hypothetical protein